MDSNIEALINKKNELERALTSVQEMLHNTATEKEQIHKLFTDFKVHFNTIKQQCSQYQKRLVEEISSRKEMEAMQDQRMHQMTKIVEQKQKDIEDLSQKMVLPIDSDILRMRIQKDLEAKYRFELETKMQELDKTTDAFYETKRQLDIVKTALESNKFESEKLVQDLRERHRCEVSELVEQNHTLELKVEENRDKEMVRKLRRDLEETKRRLNDAQSDCQEARKERDLIKLDRNEQIIKHAKELEEERTARRVLSSESDKLKFKVKCLEDDLHKQSLKAERKSQQAAGTLSEKTQILSILKEKELMVDSLRRQLNQVKEELYQKDQELENQIRRDGIENKEKGMLDRKEKTRLQRDMETLERNYTELDQQRQKELHTLQEELKASQLSEKSAREIQAKREYEFKDISMKFDGLQKNLLAKKEENEVLQKDFNRLLEKQRELMTTECNLQTSNEQLNVQQKVKDDEISKVRDYQEMEKAKWGQEKQDLNDQIQQLVMQHEKIKDECLKKVVIYKDKYSDYKTKVKQANAQINVLMQRVARYELGNNSAVDTSAENNNQRRLVQNMNQYMDKNDPLNKEIDQVLQQQTQF